MPHPLEEPGIPGSDPCSIHALRAFKRAMMLHRRLAGELFAEIDLHPAQAGCLHALAHHDGLGQSDLADMLHVSRPTVTTLLQRLETAGLIERRADEADSRVTRVYLTPAGRERSAELDTVFSRVVEESFGGLDATRCEELAGLLDAHNSHVAAILEDRGVRIPDHHHLHGGAGIR